jgi:hypothetical protein
MVDDVPWRPTPAGALWAATFAAFLAIDAYLVRNGHETASEWYGRNWKRLAFLTTITLLHLHGQPRFLMRFDPYSLAANRLRHRLVIVEEVTVIPA